MPARQCPTMQFNKLEKLLPTLQKRKRMSQCAAAKPQINKPVPKSQWDEQTSLRNQNILF